MKDKDPQLQSKLTECATCPADSPCADEELNLSPLEIDLILLCSGIGREPALVW